MFSASTWPGWGTATSLTLTSASVVFGFVMAVIGHHFLGIAVDDPQSLYSETLIFALQFSNFLLGKSCRFATSRAHSHDRVWCHSRVWCHRKETAVYRVGRIIRLSTSSLCICVCACTRVCLSIVLVASRVSGWDLWLNVLQFLVSLLAMFCILINIFWLRYTTCYCLGEW